MSSRRDRETRELLDELEATLDAMREELDERGAGGTRERRRPPTPGELVRFTEEYTIPTVIATLEATVASLELLRAFLRLVDPDRSAGDRADRAGDRLGRASESAVAGVERALSELGRALSADELPDDPAARALVADARELSEEIEARLRESRRGTEPDRADRGVRIEVDDEGGDADDGREDTDGRSARADDGVDVDAELESIRDELRGGGRDDQDET